MATPAELESFVSTVTAPVDLGSFWAEVNAELSSLPLDPELSPAPLRSTPDVKVYEVHYRSLGGLRIAGWYCVPAQGTGPFPALIEFPGYKSDPSLPRAWAQRGVASLSVAVRGKLGSHQQFNPGYPGLLTSGVEDPSTYSYRGVISDCMRGVDFLLTRPEVDQERIFAHGASQGGGLDPDHYSAPARDQSRRSILPIPVLDPRRNSPGPYQPLQRVKLLPKGPSGPKGTCA